MSSCRAASTGVMSEVSEALARKRGSLGCDPVGGVVSTGLLSFAKRHFPGCDIQCRLSDSRKSRLHAGQSR